MALMRSVQMTFTASHALMLHHTDGSSRIYVRGRWAFYSSIRGAGQRTVRGGEYGHILSSQTIECSGWVVIALRISILPQKVRNRIRLEPRRLNNRNINSTRNINITRLYNASLAADTACGMLKGEPLLLRLDDTINLYLSGTFTILSLE